MSTEMCEQRGGGGWRHLLLVQMLLLSSVRLMLLRLSEAPLLRLRCIRLRGVMPRLLRREGRVLLRSICRLLRTEGVKRKA